jgi:dextranase
VEGVADNVRRLHLNAVQFYDWMYRHADLLPPHDDFSDTLGRQVSLESVRSLVAAITAAGSLPLGYAAVYAAGKDEWPQWQDEGLYRANGEPWMLGDFLWNVDPDGERWREHFAADLKAAVADVGFAGFHLDQYGAPKTARRADGTPVDLSVAFPALIGRLARELPDSRLIFNNVNDFPTWTTAATDQDAVYIEVWSPHDTLRDVAWLADKAHTYAPEKSVILAAYLSVFAKDDEASALNAQRLLLATAFTHGATVLLHGEDRDVLTEAYYVTHGKLSPAAQDVTRRYYDFAVRYGDLLFDRGAIDLTTTHIGGVNEEAKLEVDVPVSHDGRAGTLWARLLRVEQGRLLSLISLADQDDELWDSGKKPIATLEGVRLSVERTGATPPRFLAASPEDDPALRELEPSFDGRYDSVTLPPFTGWSIVWMPS